MRYFVIILSTFFSFLLLEIFTRVFLDNGLNYEIEMMKYANQLKKISNNREVGIEHKNNKKAHLMGVEVELNNHGFRNSALDTNSKKILMLGDSMVFGWGVKYPFPNILNDRLRDYEVINAGIGNTNTVMQIENFFQNYQNKFKYDLIILNFFINDLEKVEVRKPNFLQKNSFFYTKMKMIIVL